MLYTMMQVCKETNMTYQALKFYCNEGLDWEDDHLVVPAPLVEAGKCLIDFMVDPCGDFDFLTLNAHGCNEKREKQCKTSHDRQNPP